MIESRYWRQALREDIRWLRANRSYKRWSEKRLVLFERRLMLVAFQVRSLIERPKVSAAVAAVPFRCTSYPRLSTPPPNLMSMAEFWEHFDMKKPRTVEIPVATVCNQLIHHYLMGTPSEGTSFSAVIVYSDYMRNKQLFEMELPSLIDFFARFASEDSALSEGKLTWDAKREDFVFHG